MIEAIAICLGIFVFTSMCFWAGWIMGFHDGWERHRKTTDDPYEPVPFPVFAVDLFKSVKEKKK